MFILRGTRLRRLRLVDLQEVEGAEARDMARTEALEDELADASSAREVLALALARLLRDTKACQAHPDDTAKPVAALETQLNNLSVRDSKTSSPPVSYTHLTLPTKA